MCRHIGILAYWHIGILAYWQVVVYEIALYYAVLTCEGFKKDEIFVVIDSELHSAAGDWLIVVESYLKGSNLWSTDVPEASALLSNVPFAADKLRFLQWLQWVFMPKLSELINNRKMLPKGCCIRPYAEEALKQEPACESDSFVRQRLVSLAGEIDKLLS